MPVSELSAQESTAIRYRVPEREVRAECRRFPEFCCRLARVLLSISIDRMNGGRFGQRDPRSNRRAERRDDEPDDGHGAGPARRRSGDRRAEDRLDRRRVSSRRHHRQ